jgi:hypothetical protein
MRLHQATRKRVLMRVDQSRHQRSACEIHALRSGTGSRQDLILRADRNDLAAGDRDGLRGRVAVVHRDHRASEEDGSRRLVNRRCLGREPGAGSGRSKKIAGAM